MTKKPKAKRANLYRTGTVTKWSAGVGVMLADKVLSPGNRLGGIDLTLEGDMSEPVKGVSSFVLRLYPTTIGDDEKVKCVGAVMKAKPALELLLFVTLAELQLIATLAASGVQIYCRFGFQEPKYNQGEVHTFTISTQHQQDEDDE
jgi:hypothetical protein